MWNLCITSSVALSWAAPVASIASGREDLFVRKTMGHLPLIVLFRPFSAPFPSFPCRAAAAKRLPTGACMRPVRCFPLRGGKRQALSTGLPVDRRWIHLPSPAASVHGAAPSGRPFHNVWKGLWMRTKSARSSGRTCVRVRENRWSAAIRTHRSLIGFASPSVDEAVENRGCSGKV